MQIFLQSFCSISLFRGTALCIILIRAGYTMGSPQAPMVLIHQSLPSPKHRSHWSAVCPSVGSVQGSQLLLMCGQLKETKAVHVTDFLLHWGQSLDLIHLFISVSSPHAPTTLVSHSPSLENWRVYRVCRDYDLWAPFKQEWSLFSSLFAPPTTHKESQ
jgi:hypothetical protein